MVQDLEVLRAIERMESMLREYAVEVREGRESTTIATDRVADAVQALTAAVRALTDFQNRIIWYLVLGIVASQLGTKAVELAAHALGVH